MGQAEIFFAEGGEVRGEDDATAVAGPSVGVEGGIIFRQVGVTGVAKNAFDEVQVANEVSGSKESYFKTFPFNDARDFRDDHRAQKEADEGFGLLFLPAGEGEAHDFAWRGEGVSQQSGKNTFGHRNFVSRNGKASFSDMEGAFGGAPIVERVVQDALLDAVAGDDIAEELVTFSGQGEGSGDAVAFKGKGVAWQSRDRVCDIGQVGVEKVLNAFIAGGQIIR